MGYAEAKEVMAETDVQSRLRLDYYHGISWRPLRIRYLLSMRQGGDEGSDIRDGSIRENAVKITHKWTREKAYRVRGIIERLGLCACGNGTHWQCVLEVLSEAEKHSPDGFCRDAWFELTAKFLDKFGLLEHGTSIGFAWLTEDGRLLLEFLRDFGTEDADIESGKSQPFWSIDLGWSVKDSKIDDSYAEWHSSAEGEVPQPGVSLKRGESSQDKCGKKMAADARRYQYFKKYARLDSSDGGWTNFFRFPCLGAFDNTPYSVQRGVQYDYRTDVDAAVDLAIKQNEIGR